MINKPDPKDPKYENRLNLFVKDMLFWQGTQFLEPIPDDELRVPLNGQGKCVGNRAAALRIDIPR